MLGDRQPVAIEQSAHEDRLCEHHAEDQHRKENAQTPDQARKTRQLTVERRLFVVLHGGLLRHPPGLRRVAHGRDDHHAVTVRHGRPPQHGIRRISRLGIEIGLIDGLVDLGFAREGRFVDFQRHGLDQFAVGRDRLAALDVDHVARNDVAARNFADRAFAHHFDGDVVVDLIQPPETPLGVPLEPEADACGEDDGADDTHGFREIPVNETDDQRQHGGQQQDADDRIAELFEQQTPHRVVFRRGDDVVAVLTPAFSDFLRGESPGIEGYHSIVKIWSGKTAASRHRAARR